jgi:hypothetical protein
MLSFVAQYYRFENGRFENEYRVGTYRNNTLENKKSKLEPRSSKWPVLFLLWN